MMVSLTSLYQSGVAGKRRRRPERRLLLHNVAMSEHERFDRMEPVVLLLKFTDRLLALTKAVLEVLHVEAPLSIGLDRFPRTSMRMQGLLARECLEVLRPDPQLPEVFLKVKFRLLKGSLHELRGQPWPVF